jgi:hypothetical protein
MSIDMNNCKDQEAGIMNLQKKIIRKRIRNIN